jgi:4-aminobutyrate aminotransferase
MLAFELSKEKYKHIIETEAFKKGLMLLGCGEKSIRIVPPLIINRDEIDEGMETIQQVVKSLKK